VAQAPQLTMLRLVQVEFRSLAVRLWAMPDSMAQVFALEDLRFSSGAWLLIVILGEPGRRTGHEFR
jgi:hypothetical protein